MSGVQLNAAHEGDLKMGYGPYSKPLFSPCLQEKRAQHNEVLHIQVRGMQGSGAECQQFSSHEIS